MAFEKIHKQMVECMSRIPVIQLTRVEDAAFLSINQHFSDDTASENDWNRRYPARDRRGLSNTVDHRDGELSDDKEPSDSDGNDSSDSEFQIKTEKNQEEDVEEYEPRSPRAPPKKRRRRASRVPGPDEPGINNPNNPKPKRRRGYTPRCRPTKKERTCSCGEAFMSLKQLSIHATTKHGIEKPFICGTCQEPFSDVHLFLAHKNDVHDFMNTTATKAIRLQRRSAKIDWTPADFICHYCGKKWNSARELKQHIVEIHRRIDSVTTCELCDVKSKSIESLRHHFQTIHLGFKHTGSARKMQDKLKETQGGEVPVTELKVQNFVTCELCGKIFWWQWRLDEHMGRTHKVRSEEKEKLHREKAHEKPHACHECGLFYRSRNTLIEHFNSKKHRSDKTLMCENCGKTFRKPDGLRKHIAREHPEIPLPRRFEYGPSAFEDPNSRKMTHSVFDNLLEEASFFDEVTQLSTAEAEFPQGQLQNNPLALLPGLPFLQGQGQHQSQNDPLVTSGTTIPVPHGLDQPQREPLPLSVAVPVIVARGHDQPASNALAVSHEPSPDQPQRHQLADSSVPVPLKRVEEQPQRDPPAVSSAPVPVVAHQEFNIPLAPLPLAVPVSDPIEEIHSLQSMYEEAPNIDQEPFEEIDVKPSLPAFESFLNEEDQPFDDHDDDQPMASPVSGNRSDDDSDFEMRLDKERLRRLRRACKRRSLRSRKGSNEDSVNGPVDVKIEHSDDSQWEDVDKKMYSQQDFNAEDAAENPSRIPSKRKAKTSRSKSRRSRQGTEKIACRLNGCRFRAKDHDQLAEHRKDVHGRSDVRNYNFRCDQCNFKATKPESLELHQRTHTQVHNIQLKSRDSKSLPVTPKSSQKSEVKILCRLSESCRFRAVDHAELAQHRLDVHGRTDPPRSYDFKCAQCKFKATTSESLQLHQHIHNTQGRLKNRYRAGGVSRKASKALIRRRNSQPEVKCRLTGCRFRAVDVQELVQHRMDVHGRTDPIRSYDFKCKQCTFRATSAESLEFHQRKHDPSHALQIQPPTGGQRHQPFGTPRRFYRKPDLKIVCRLDGCRFRANDRNHLADHRRNIHGRAVNPVRLYQFKCTEPLCTFRARYLESYESHLLTHKLVAADAEISTGTNAAGTPENKSLNQSPAPAYPCTHPGCRLRFHSRVRLISHIHRVHRNTPTAARVPLPAPKIVTPGSLEATSEHVLVSDIFKNPRKCRLHGCRFVAIKRSDLEVHRLTLHGSAWARSIRKPRMKPAVPWKYCGIDSCTFKALMPESIANHQRTVHDKLPPTAPSFPCPHCDKTYSTHSYRLMHINLKHTGGTAPRVPCHHCTRDFSCRIALFGHIQRDHPDKPTFPCGICTKIFYYEDERTLHEEKHMKFSGGETRFKCVVQNCTEVCTNQESLIDHVKSMHDVRIDAKIICPTCGKEYLASTYSAHARTHTERERKHKCEECPKAFRKPIELEGHLEAAHPELFDGQEKTFICDTCGISFYMKGSFNTHRYRFHGKNPRPGYKPRSRKPKTRKSSAGTVSGTMSGTVGGRVGTVTEDGIGKPKRKRRTKAEMLREREDMVNRNRYQDQESPERDPRPCAPNPKASKLNFPIAQAQDEMSMSPEPIMPHPPPAHRNQSNFQQYYQHQNEAFPSQLLPYFLQNSQMAYSNDPHPPPLPPHYLYHP